MGNVNEIISTLYERPFEKHRYKAARLMREGLLINSLLTNSESWVNVTEKELSNLEKLDILLQRKLLTESGNPSKAFMCLELGSVPVKFVIMSKRVHLLKYILEEPTGSMIRDVFNLLKEDSRKGDFVNLVERDLRELKITMSHDEIQQCSKGQWKQLVKKHVRETAF